MKLTSHQKKLIREGIMDHIVNWIVDKQYWKAKKMFEDDPELQKITQRVFDSITKAEKQAEDYCKKYGCIEPTKHTIKLEKFKDIRAKKGKK
jgi:hypothetical protein